MRMQQQQPPLEQLVDEMAVADTVSTAHVVADAATSPDPRSEADRATAIVADALKQGTSETWAHASFRSRADRAKNNYDALLRNLAVRSSRIRKHVSGTYRHLRRIIERHEQRAMETLAHETKQQEKLLLDRARLDYAIESKWVIERGLNQELQTLRVSSGTAAATAAVSATSTAGFSASLDQQCRDLVRQKDRLRVAMLKDLYFELNTLTAVRETVNARLTSVERSWNEDYPTVTCRVGRRKSRAEKDESALMLLRRVLEESCSQLQQQPQHQHRVYAPPTAATPTPTPTTTTTTTIVPDSSDWSCAATATPSHEAFSQTNGGSSSIVGSFVDQRPQPPPPPPPPSSSSSFVLAGSAATPYDGNGYHSLLARLYSTPRTCVICCNFLPGHRFLFAADCSHSHCVDCLRRACSVNGSAVCMECRKPITSFVELVRCTANGERYTFRPCSVPCVRQPQLPPRMVTVDGGRPS